MTEIVTMTMTVTEIVTMTMTMTVTEIVTMTMTMTMTVTQMAHIFCCIR